MADSFRRTVIVLLVSFISVSYAARLDETVDQCSAQTCVDCTNSFGNCGWCAKGPIASCTHGDNLGPLGNISCGTWTFEPHSCKPTEQRPLPPHIEGDEFAVRKAEEATSKEFMSRMDVISATFKVLASKVHAIEEDILPCGDPEHITDSHSLETVNSQAQRVCFDTSCHYFHLTFVLFSCRTF